MERIRPIQAAFVEDQLTIRKSIIHYIETSPNIQVTIEAGDGIELLELLESAPDLPDICIIDLNMPRMHGVKLLEEIRLRWPDMRSLILTAFDNELLVTKLIKLGANGYLLKNTDPDEIIEAIECICESGYYYSGIAGSKVFKMVQEDMIKAIHLTESEIEFLKLLETEMTYSEIADRMGKSARSIDGYRDRLNRKLNTRSRTGLLLAAVKMGIINIEFSNH